MNQMAKIAQSATPSSAVQFRKTEYGQDEVQAFLCDVLAMANASAEGPRYIVTGAEVDAKGVRRFFPVKNDGLAANASYQALVDEHVEPPLRLRHEVVRAHGKRVGVFEIEDCRHRPYMMRVDFSETLRRGDAYARVNDRLLKLGRRQLQGMFEQHFRDAIPAPSIEIGFEGTILHKEKTIETSDLSKLPSRLASEKLAELVESKERLQASLANTVLARLTHARVFGSDSPYKKRSYETIIEEMKSVAEEHRDEDEHCLFNLWHSEIELVVLYEGEEPLEDPSLDLLLPSHEALHIATQLPKIRRNGKFFDRSPGEQAGYPDVSVQNDSIRISASPGNIDSGEPRRAFSMPLRVCVGEELKGRRLRINYRLAAKNLRQPAKGKLKLLFV